MTERIYRCECPSFVNTREAVFPSNFLRRGLISVCADSRSAALVRFLRSKLMTHALSLPLKGSGGAVQSEFDP